MKQMHLNGVDRAGLCENYDVYDMTNEDYYSIQNVKL